MPVIPRTPLDAWTAGKLKLAAGLTKSLIRRRQLDKLRQTIRATRELSPFYRRRLAGFCETNLAGLEDLARFPFTTEADVRKHPLQFLCVSQSEISRAVTLHTSGTTGAAKRLFFTAADQELTVDFFQHGMATLVGPGDRALILLPGERPGSVGRLLAEGLRRLGVTSIPHGFVRSLPETLNAAQREAATALVGVPAQVLALARYSEYTGTAPKLCLRNILLSTDYIPGAVSREIERIWNCAIFRHYGMTEMGLGGGVECLAHAGYHLRELDLYFEIIDPRTGQVLPEGEYGEVVFTTLTRRGMPLVRYRTGDLSAFVPGLCPCGSPLRRLGSIRERLEGKVRLPGEQWLTMADLDETLFALAGVADFTAVVAYQNDMTRLTIEAVVLGQHLPDGEAAIAKAAAGIDPVRRAGRTGKLILTVRAKPAGDCWQPRAEKRVIRVAETD